MINHAWKLFESNETGRGSVRFTNKLQPIQLVYWVKLSSEVYFCSILGWSECALEDYIIGSNRWRFYMNANISQNFMCSLLGELRDSIFLFNSNIFEIELIGHEDSRSLETKISVVIFVSLIPNETSSTLNLHWITRAAVHTEIHSLETSLSQHYRGC